MLASCYREVHSSDLDPNQGIGLFKHSTTICCDDHAILM